MSDPRVEELKRLLPQCMLPDWVRLGTRLARLLRDQHHSEKHEALLARLTEQVHASVKLREDRRANVPRVAYPENLPISMRAAEIVAAIRAHQVVIIAGETGSGKTTQIPKMCLEAGLGIEAKIGCTQPRRVAALSISSRIAEELKVSWGREVGCKIRYDDHSSAETFIKLMTDGILLAETQGDPMLSEYNALILDEAHERSLNIDFLLGYLKGLLEKRQDLKLIVTSATIDTQAFSKHFNDAPIIEVSGRVYPVDVIYQPLDGDSEESGEISYVDATVQACMQIVWERGAGDVLIFMPGERDIREATDQLEGRLGGDAEVIPMFGRLSAEEQQRVFSESPRRKIIIATNIAETSLTIPGIRYVIDSGLVRMSRYNPRTRTRRLPVEPVSQSSANQRKGRAGRVETGLCIRLYSEEDFIGRPEFTQPEIQRANLAEVILRMKAFGLGEIETFPFIQPPTPAAINNGYVLLQELGALDEKRDLTQLGRDLARLPIDPTLGRMLLQSQKEHATHELLIIAAGLSIQDPRERPLDQKEAASAAHKRFNDPQSDFLALLNIWNAVHDQWETLRTQNQRQKFCKQNFLSYIRMREWQDLYTQLHDALSEIRNVRLNESSADYGAIHRSILAGLLGHIALHEERNLYKGAGNRKITVFPGSALYERGEPPHKRGQGANPPARKSTQPEWIMAGEIVETSQLFARTIAGIDPHWIAALATHLSKLTHQNPRWDAKSGRVIADEIVSLYGLELIRQRVAYGRINPKEATEIFIRRALIEGEEQELEPPADRYAFFKHNRAIVQKIQNWQTRVRHYEFANLDDTLFRFYAERIENVSSWEELNRLLHESVDEQFLFLTESELAGDKSLQYDAAAFPNSVCVSGENLPVEYAYAPGDENDGVTINVAAQAAHRVAASELEWAVPGLREEKIAELLRSLPKTLRRELMPFAPKVTEIAREFAPTGNSFTQDLGRFIHKRYGVAIPTSAWAMESLPAHLRPRVCLLAGPKTVASGRDFQQLLGALEKVKLAPAAEPPAWQHAIQHWERFALTGWTIGDLPARITISEAPASYAWPGLLLEDKFVSLRLFRTEQSAQAATVKGVFRLVEIALAKELAWVEKDLRALVAWEKLFAPRGKIDELRETAMTNLKNHILPSQGLPQLTEAAFRQVEEASRQRIPGIAQRLVDLVGEILKLRQQVSLRIGASAAPQQIVAKAFAALDSIGQRTPPVSPISPFAAELNALVPPRFLESISFEHLPHLLRYLKALLIRMERAALNPVKDKERARQIEAYQRLFAQLPIPTGSEAAPLREEFRWMIEEFKVSLFAQELGTALPVSPKRLDDQLERIRQAL